MVDLNKGLDLVAIGREYLRNVHRNFATPRLYEEIVNNREGQISHRGPLVVRTGHYAERSFTDRLIVKEPVSEKIVSWDEKVKPISQEHFKSLFYRLLAYMQNKEVYVQYAYGCMDTKYQTPIRFVTEKAWHGLFIRNMFEPVRDPELLKKIHVPEAFGRFESGFSVVHIPGFNAIPELDGTNSSSFVIFNLGLKVVVFGGSSYAGEILEGTYTMINHLLAEKSVLPVRCAANIGENDDVAIFIGRRGTGKTALAIDPQRRLIGGQLHGWTDDGVFSYDRGNYSKVLNISGKAEPEVYQSTRKFGTVLENVFIDLETRRINLQEDSLTQNIRAAYPNLQIPNWAGTGEYGHPKHLFLLTSDAFGVLPPIAKLTPEQAIFAFLSSYTSRFTKAETGKMEAHPLFSINIGSSVLHMKAHEYAKKLLEKIKTNDVTCWMMNTGWSGEAYNRGSRIDINYSRALIRGAVSGKLDEAPFETDPVFQFEIPTKCPDVPDELLNPRKTADDEGEYELRANRLAREFMKDYELYISEMPENMQSMLSQVLTFDDSFDLLDDLNLSI